MNVPAAENMIGVHLGNSVTECQSPNVRVATMWDGCGSNGLNVLNAVIIQKLNIVDTVVGKADTVNIKN